MLPNGYQTVLEGDGSGLSQGQRQLISIARAAVADPPAMILDEATSSIDTRTEEVVQAGMDNLMKGRTVFVIAHRLSTVRNSDVIMVLDHGRIIERGSHDELIAQKGEYYQLYTGAVELRKPHMWLPHGPCAYGSHESAGMTFYAGCARCGFSWIPRINGEKSIAGTTHAVP